MDAVTASERSRAGALAWRGTLEVPHGVAWLEEIGREGEYAAGPEIALRDLFGAREFPAVVAADDLIWHRDALGKPYLQWHGALRHWAAVRNRSADCLHVSNSHDGQAHLILAAYAEDLVGIGIDVVELSRLRRPGKDCGYLRRFARQFMSTSESALFAEAATDDDEESLRIRVAAHFSLMEAASKACGTGLKIGAGMGNALSLPKASLGVRRLSPGVELLFGPEARARLEALQARSYCAVWSADGDYLVSVVLLKRREETADDKNTGAATAPISSSLHISQSEWQPVGRC